MPFDLGSVAGGAFSYLGQESANRANARMASAQMGFQKHMSDTSHQREVKDLVAAGLNPILSANNGASTPNGAAATAENSIGSGIASAIELRNLKLSQERQAKDIELIDAQKKKTNMETLVMSKGVPEAELKNQIYNSLKTLFPKLRDAFNSNAKPDKSGNMPVFLPGSNKPHYMRLP